MIYIHDPLNSMQDAEDNLTRYVYHQVSCTAACREPYPALLFASRKSQSKDCFNRPRRTRSLHRSMAIYPRATPVSRLMTQACSVVCVGGKVGDAAFAISR